MIIDSKKINAGWVTTFNEYGGDWDIDSWGNIVFITNNDLFLVSPYGHVQQIAWDAFEEVGPGNHFLGSAHTMRHYTTAFYQHSVFSMDNYELWEEKGSPDSYKLANSRWKQMLEEYQPPTLDEAIAEEMQDFVAQRRAELRDRKARTEWRYS